MGSREQEAHQGQGLLQAEQGGEEAQEGRQKDPQEGRQGQEARYQKDPQEGRQEACGEKDPQEGRRQEAGSQEARGEKDPQEGRSQEVSPQRQKVRPFMNDKPFTNAGLESRPPSSKPTLI